MAELRECPLCQAEVETHQGRFAVHGDCPGGFALIDEADGTSEGRYTNPSAWCPHPDRWHSADWDSAELETSELVGALAGVLKPDIVVETGSAFGQTAHAIGTALSINDCGVLHTIEVSPERADITRKRCEGLPVVVEQMSSLDFIPPGQVGLAWFDSLLPLRVPEFRHFYEWLAPGAIVGFHDVAPHFGPQMMHDIEALEEEGLLLPMALRTPRGIVLGEVVK